MDELIDSFSLERVVKSGARFDPEKARWFNRNYLLQKTETELSEQFKPMLAAKNIQVDDEKLLRMIGLIKERCEFVADLWQQGNYFFEAPKTYDEKTVSKTWKEDTPDKLSAITGLFKTIESWTAPEIKEIFSAFMNEKGWGFGAVMAPVRLALVGSSQGVDLFDICELIGKDETIGRIERAIRLIG